MSNTWTQDCFDWVVAREVIREHGIHDLLVNLSWQLNQPGEWLIQLYVDDDLYHVISDAHQLGTWLVLDRSRRHRIELLAIQASDEVDPWESKSEQLESWSPRVADVARVEIERDERLPVDTLITVNVAGRSEQKPLWSSVDPRGGFGGVFGEGRFGYDDAASLNDDPEDEVESHGAGAPFIWRSDDLPAGEHVLVVNATDKQQANTSLPTAIDPLVVDALPVAPRNLQISSESILSWTP